MNNPLFEFTSKLGTFYLSNRVLLRVCSDLKIGLVDLVSEVSKGNPHVCAIVVSESCVGDLSYDQVIDYPDQPVGWHIRLAVDILNRGLGAPKDDAEVADKAPLE